MFFQEDKKKTFKFEVQLIQQYVMTTLIGI